MRNLNTCKTKKENLKIRNIIDFIFYKCACYIFVLKYWSFSIELVPFILFFFFFVHIHPSLNIFLIDFITSQNSFQQIKKLRFYSLIHDVIFFQVLDFSPHGPSNFFKKLAARGLSQNSFVPYWRFDMIYAHIECCYIWTIYIYQMMMNVDA